MSFKQILQDRPSDIPVSDWRLVAVLDIDAGIHREVATSARVIGQAGVHAGVPDSGLPHLQVVLVDDDVAGAGRADRIAVVVPVVAQAGVARRGAGQPDGIASDAVELLRSDVQTIGSRWGMRGIALDIDMDVLLVAVQFVDGLAAITALVGLPRGIEDQPVALGTGAVGIGLAVHLRPGDGRSGIALHLADDLVGLVLLEGHRLGQADNRGRRALGMSCGGKIILKYY